MTRQPCTEKQPSTYSRLSMSMLPAGASFSSAAARARGSRRRPWHGEGCTLAAGCGRRCREVARRCCWCRTRAAAAAGSGAAATAWGRQAVADICSVWSEEANWPTDRGLREGAGRLSKNGPLHLSGRPGQRQSVSKCWIGAQAPVLDLWITNRAAVRPARAACRRKAANRVSLRNMHQSFDRKAGGPSECSQAEGTPGTLPTRGRGAMQQAGFYGGAGWGDAHVSPQFTNPTKVGAGLDRSPPAPSRPADRLSGRYNHVTRHMPTTTKEATAGWRRRRA